MDKIRAFINYLVLFHLYLNVALMCAAGGYSVLGWNHPGFGGSTVRSVISFATFKHTFLYRVFSTVLTNNMREINVEILASVQQHCLRAHPWNKILHGSVCDLSVAVFNNMDIVSFFLFGILLPGSAIPPE